MRLFPSTTARAAGRSLRRLCLAGAALSVFAGPATAQIVTDGTVGAGGALTGPNYVIGQGLGLTNADGTALLHSFSQFDLLAGESATFTGAGTLQSIIARITGGASSIDGTITHSIGAADLYFINPNGIVFGANAFIDVPGSFHVATADTLNFADGSSIPMTATPVGTLSTAAIESFGFLGGGTGQVIINGTAPLPGVDPDLFGDIGGNLTLTGSQVDVRNRRLVAGDSEGGRGLIRVAAVGAETGNLSLIGRPEFYGGRIQWQDAAVWESARSAGGSFDFIASADETLIHNTVPGEFRWSPGLITNGSGNTSSLTFYGGLLSFLNATLGRSFFGGGIGPTAQSGFFTADLDGAFIMGTSSIYTGSFGVPGGDVTVSANTIMVDDSRIDTTAAAFDGGDIIMTAADSFAVINNSFILSGLFSTPVNVGGFLDPLNPGNGGDITIVAGGRMEVTNSAIQSVSLVQTGTDGGASGDVSIAADDLFITGGGISASATAGTRSGGAVSVTTTGGLFLNGGSISASNTDGGPTNSTGGDGGSVTLNVAEFMSMTNGSFVRASGYNGGSIDITTGLGLTVDGSTINASSLPSLTTTQAGSGGQIVVRSGGDIDITDGAVMAYTNVTTAAPGGNAGAIDLDAAGDMTFTRSRIFSNVFAAAPANARNGGTIRLRAGGNIASIGTSFDASGSLNFGAGVFGDGGSIRMEADGDIDLLQDAGTFAASELEAVGGNAGDIYVRANGRFNLDESDLFAFSNSPGGSGGDIVVLADSIVLGINSDIIARAFDGPSGNILLRAQEISINGGIGDSPLPGGAIDYDPAEILIGGTDGGRMVLEANTINLGVTYSLRSEHLGATGQGGEIILRANTINALTVQSGEILSTSNLGTAGDIRIEALDFFMGSGSISTQGPAGGTIRIGVDRAFEFTGGSIFTNIDAEGPDQTDGDVYIGFTFAPFERTNPLCDTQCQNWPVFVPGPAPGAGGIPTTFTDESDVLEAQGDVGQVIFGWSRNTFAPVLADTVGVEPAPAAEPDPTGDAEASETQGYAYATATSREPASLCTVEEERRAGRSALTELLTGVEAGSPLNLAPARYGAPDTRQAAAARSDLPGCMAPAGEAAPVQSVN